MLKKGDRIRFNSHGTPNDPMPLTPGEEGTVEHVGDPIPYQGGRPSRQVDVKWDSGRGLMLIVPPDSYSRIAGEGDMYRVSSTDDKAKMLDNRFAHPGFPMEQVEQADTMELWGTKFSDDNAPDYCEFRLLKGDEVFATKRIDGY